MAAPVGRRPRHRLRARCAAAAPGGERPPPAALAAAPGLGPGAQQRPPAGADRRGRGRGRGRRVCRDEARHAGRLVLGATRAARPGRRAGRGSMPRPAAPATPPARWSRSSSGPERRSDHEQSDQGALAGAPERGGTTTVPVQPRAKKGEGQRWDISSGSTWGRPTRPRRSSGTGRPRWRRSARGRRRSRRWSSCATTARCWSARPPSAAARPSPTAFAREFKRRIGDPTPMLLGGSPFSAARADGPLLRCGGRAWSPTARAGRPTPSPSPIPANWGAVQARPARPGAATRPTLGRRQHAHRARGGRRPLRLDRPGRRRARSSPSTTWAAARSTPPSLRNDGRPASSCSASPRASSSSAASTSTRRCSATCVGARVRARSTQLDPDDPAAWPPWPACAATASRPRRRCRGDTEVTIPVALPDQHTEVRLTRGRVRGHDPARAGRRRSTPLRRALRSAGVEPDAARRGAARRRLVAHPAGRPDAGAPSWGGRSPSTSTPSTPSRWAPLTWPRPAPAIARRRRRPPPRPPSRPRSPALGGARWTTVAGRWPQPETAADRASPSADPRRRRPARPGRRQTQRRRWGPTARTAQPGGPRQRRAAARAGEAATPGPPRSAGRRTGGRAIRPAAHPLVLVGAGAAVRRSARSPCSRRGRRGATTTPLGRRPPPSAAEAPPKRRTTVATAAPSRSLRARRWPPRRSPTPRRTAILEHVAGRVSDGGPPAAHPRDRQGPPAGHRPRSHVRGLHGRDRRPVELRVTDSQGNGELQLATGLAADARADLVARRHRLAFVGDPEGQADIYVLDLATGDHAGSRTRPRTKATRRGRPTAPRSPTGALRRQPGHLHDARRRRQARAAHRGPGRRRRPLVVARRRPSPSPATRGNWDIFVMSADGRDRAQLTDRRRRRPGPRLVARRRLSPSSPSATAADRGRRRTSSRSTPWRRRLRPAPADHPRRARRPPGLGPGAPG